MHGDSFGMGALGCGSGGARSWRSAFSSACVSSCMCFGLYTIVAILAPERSEQLCVSVKSVPRAMPRSQQSPEDLAAKHFQKGLNSKAKSEMDEACKLLRANPSVAAQFLPAIRAAAARARGPDDGRVDKAHNVAESEANHLGIKFCPQYTKFNATPNQLLRFYLSQMEPQIMSLYSLKALNPKGAKECPREVLAQLCEFLTGIAMDEVIPLHCRTSLDTLVEYLQARNIARERRGFYIRLPPSWDGGDGLFRVVAVTGRDVVVSFRLQETYSITLDIGMDTRPDDLTITSAWSEKGATLICKQSMNIDWNLNQEFAKRGYDVTKLGGFNVQSKTAYRKLLNDDKQAYALANSPANKGHAADMELATPPRALAPASVLVRPACGDRAASSSGGLASPPHDEACMADLGSPAPAPAQAAAAAATVASSPEKDGARPPAQQRSRKRPLSLRHGLLGRALRQRQAAGAAAPVHASAGAPKNSAQTDAKAAQAAAAAAATAPTMSDASGDVADGFAPPAPAATAKEGDGSASATGSGKHVATDFPSDAELVQELENSLVGKAGPGDVEVRPDGTFTS